MVRAIMHGCNGKMGRVITGLIRDDDAIEIVAGIDTYTGTANDYPVFESIEACDVEADVVIDFSNASAVDHLLDYCAKKKLPVVLCTTGLSEEQLRKVEETAEQTAVLKSANMSLGINLLLKLLQNAAKVLGPAGFDIELVERHHNQKVDAPSGTALALADSVNEALDNQYTYVFDRSQVRQKRGEKEIGISAVRGGTIDLYERIRSKISGKTFTAVSDYRKSINGNYQSAGNPEPAKGHRAFSDGYPWRT